MAFEEELEGTCLLVEGEMLNLDGARRFLHCLDGEEDETKVIYADVCTQY